LIFQNIFQIEKNKYSTRSETMEAQISIVRENSDQNLSLGLYMIMIKGRGAHRIK